jgi:uncharacterized protein YbgA (DUF1722 family)
MLKTDPTPGGLVRFHTAHNLTLMAHSPKHYAELGRLVAKAGSLPWDELVATYGARFMEGLALLGPPGRRTSTSSSTSWATSRRTCRARTSRSCWA